MPNYAAKATPFGACPLPLEAAARGIPGQKHTLSLKFARKPFAICISALQKKMGMDGLTEQKMPGGIPEPRIPNQGLLWGN